jgi:hypothetical protein
MVTAATKKRIESAESRLVGLFQNNLSGKRIESFEETHNALYINSLEGINPVNTLDIDSIARRLAEKNPAFKTSLEYVTGRRRASHGSRVEHVMDGFEKAQFAEFIKSCVSIGTLSTCPSVSADSIAAIIGEMSVECGEEELATDLFLPDLDMDVCEPPDAELKFMGLTSPLKTKVPERCQKRIGFAIKSDAFCKGLANAITSTIRTQTRPAFMKMIAKQVVRILLDAFPSTGSCRNKWSPTVNGCSFRPYYLAGQGPWANMLTQTTAWTECNARATFAAIEKVFDDLVHPVTGNLIDCCDSYSAILFGGRTIADSWKSMLGVQTIEYGACPSTGCPERTQIHHSAREGWSGVFWHRYLTKFATEIYTELYGPGTTNAYTASQITEMVERTAVIGCPSEAFKMTVETPFTQLVRQGPNTWEFFNQKIQWATSFEIKTGFFSNPFAVQSVVLLQGVPDGETVQDLENWVD